ncbi:hypothetical protein CRG98_043338, partial [Punica granatum]
LRKPPAAHGAGNYTKGALVAPRGFELGSRCKLGCTLTIRPNPLQEVHAPVLSLWRVKLVVVSAFVAFLFASIALCTKIEPGLDQKTVLPRDSYLQISQASLEPESSYIAKPAIFQPPCYPAGQSSCSLTGPWKDCTMVMFAVSPYVALSAKRPSINITIQGETPLVPLRSASAGCAKGGHGAYTNTMDLQGYEDGIIQASSFRTFHTPLNNQVDYINFLRAAGDFSSKVSKSLK